MTNSDEFAAPNLHLQERDFRAALEFTQNTTGFRSSLIEKDYFCSLVLGWLFHEIAANLVFKGGTCLHKVYLDFSRLSEDLDFSIPVPVNSSPAQRSRALAPIKKLFADLPPAVSGCAISQPLSGANRSRQYLGELRYRSALSDEPGRLKVEVSLREPLLMEAARTDAKTLLLDPFTGKPAMPGINVRCLTLAEAWAEKARAALTRPEPAIRDFFDLWHGHRSKLFSLNQPFVEMLRKKIEFSLSPYQALSAERGETLRRQVETDLRPVLTPAAYDSFAWDEAIAIVKEIERAAALK